jgi:ubiquinone/menaquinone biosynthesis C-methylase UbiE
MSHRDRDFVGSIPEIYDNFLVPLIFESYAQDLANRIGSLAPRAVLETAAGSGVVTRALTPGLPAMSSYTVTDLNQPMLDHAASKQDEDARLTWRQADAMDLPFENSVFDAVVCQFGVMFYPDKNAGYTEAYRVLKPGGTLIFNVWDRIEENEFADVVTNAVAEIFSDDPPQFLPRTAHGYYDEDTIRAELNAAGFQDVRIESKDDISSAPSPRHPAVAYCQGTPLRNEIEDRDAKLLGKATDHAAEAISDQFGAGEVSARIRGYVIAATR